MQPSRTGYIVLDAMTTKPVTVLPDASLQEAASLMRQHDIGSLIVQKGNDLMGVITEYDLVHRAIGDALDVRTTPVTAIMTRDLLTVSPSMDIFDALRLMRDADIRHLPVIDTGKMVGFITLKDILKIQPQLFELVAERLEIREMERKFSEEEE